MEEILKEILEELRWMNSRGRDMEHRIEALESRDRLVRPMEAAAMLGCSAKTLRNRSAVGKLHPVVRGGVRGYMLSELRRFKNNYGKDTE